jgi:hypothetical protein
MFSFSSRHFCNILARNTDSLTQSEFLQNIAVEHQHQMLRCMACALDGIDFLFFKFVEYDVVSEPSELFLVVPNILTNY